MADVGVRQQTISQKNLHLTSEHEDFELKKTLLCILTTLSVDKASIKVGLLSCRGGGGGGGGNLDGC